MYPQIAKSECIYMTFAWFSDFFFYPSVEY